MNVNYPALEYRLHKLVRLPFGLGSVGTLLDQAFQVNTLHAEETLPSRPCIYLEQHLEKIQAICSHRTHELEDAKIHGYAWTHAATIEYKVRNVKIRGGHLYKESAKTSLVVEKDRILRPRQDALVTSISSATMASSFSGNAYFGTFLSDDLPLCLIAENYADNIVIERPLYSHEMGYREILGCPLPDAINLADIGELTLYQDYGNNAYKRQRYQLLRNRLKQHPLSATSTFNPYVYIKRGATGEKRIVSNEAELEAYLQSIGFIIVEPAVMSAAEVSQALLGAKLVVSVEGSHISHAIYSMADHATLLVLQPPDRFSTAYKDFTDCLEMRFAFLVGDKTPEGFDIDLADLERLLNRIEQTS